MMAALGSASPAVTLSEAQAFVRVETGEEEALLAGLIRTATGLCEAFLGHVLISREFEIEMVADGSWQRVNLAPVRAIDAVQAMDANGAFQAIPSSAFAIDIDARGEGWVRVVDATGIRRIRLNGSAGMAQDQNGIPEPIRQGILRLVAHLFTARDSEGGAPPAAITALWRPYRRMRFA